MLIPFDDYPVHQTSEPLAHAGQGHPDQYDRFWFNGYTDDFYFAVALGLYPNRGVIDAGFSVVHDGVQRSVFASGRIPLDRTETRIGPITVRIVEPMRINQVLVDAPEHGLRAELTCRARTAAYEEARTARNAGTRRAWDATRATQMIGWTGELSSGGASIDLADRTVFGTKDRSWGIRPVGVAPQRAPEPGADQLFFLWSPLNFDDVCLHYMVHEDATGTPWAETAAMLPVLGEGDPVFGPDDGVRQLPGLRHEVRWAPGLRRAESATLVLPDGSGLDPRVELEPLFAFRMKGVGYFHPEWAHGTWRDELVVGGEEATTRELDVLRPDTAHLQQVVRATWGDRTGLGVLEQLVFGPYAPAGFTDTLDGAR
ncbi:hypothetical protein [Pseudonocardia spinosispora]|uniref:hypothetical protein n=1 Tax=Pseudonocardia spinosispora TaxID=103441 RepID=UPI0003FF52C6|nr:hypothetical protein [Pseudonocardia spinosispora]